ncbi:MAG TPA: hypothetical protein VD997_12595 [Phycisphaerales bacterium]|nr:hypothetical protein [Phycisphaerales bacterium]
MTDRARLLQDTLAARDKAAALLGALLESKKTIESTPSPKGDLYKRVTGASSLDNAIAETRRSIDAYERLIAQLEKGYEGPAEVITRPGQLATGAARA